MTGDHNRYIGLCLPYAFDKLNPRNRHFLERHLKSGCEICNKELAEIYEAMAVLPLAVSQKSAPSSLRNRVLALARSGKPGAEPKQERGRRRDDRHTEQRPPQPAPVTMRQSAPTQSRPWFGYAIVFLAAVVVVALGLYTNSLINRLDSQEQQINMLAGELQAQEELLRILQAPHTGMVLMNGTNLSPMSYGKVVWDQENKTAVLQVANLPAAPEDKDYQLWALKDNLPVSAGVFAFTTGPERENYLKVFSLEGTGGNNFDAFVVTLEPKGGSPAPTGEKYLTSENLPK